MQQTKHPERIRLQGQEGGPACFRDVSPEASSPARAGTGTRWVARLPAIARPLERRAPKRHTPVEAVSRRLEAGRARASFRDPNAAGWEPGTWSRLELGGRRGGFERVPQPPRSSATRRWGAGHNGGMVLRGSCNPKLRSLHRFYRLIAYLLLGVVFLTDARPQSAYAQSPTKAGTIDVIEVTGVIDPSSASYVQDRLRRAERDGAEAAILQLDTPGGLEVSMRAMVQDILGSRVPVVAWVAPRGARAASAGTFLTYAAHLAYMADATEIGAATPVNLGQSSEVLERKATSDAAAALTELARERGRNTDFAQDAVRRAASIGATQAVQTNVVDGKASSLRQLLEAMDEAKVDVAGRGEVILETWDTGAGAPSVTVRFQHPNPLEQLLHALTSPEVAFLLLLVGMFGLIFELYNPGIGLAGILGAVSLLLSFYGLSILPTDWLGVLLIVLGAALFVVDLQAAGLGVWTLGGLIALVTGGLILFSGAPELELPLWALVAGVAGTLLFFISVMTAALRVRLRRPITGEESLVGMVGEATTDIAPEGTVLTKGILWRARTMETGIAAGSRVEVKATEGLVLLVEPVHEVEPSSTA